MYIPLTGLLAVSVADFTLSSNISPPTTAPNTPHLSRDYEERDHAPILPTPLTH